MTKLLLPALAAFAALAAVAGCAAPAGPVPAPTLWQPDDIIVPARLEGRLLQEKGCLVLRTERSRAYFLAWPIGTAAEEGALRMRGDSGRERRFRIGARVRLEGEHLLAEHGHYLPYVHEAAARCDVVGIFLVRDGGG